VKWVRIDTVSLLLLSLLVAVLLAPGHGTAAPLSIGEGALKGGLGGCRLQYVLQHPKGPDTVTDSSSDVIVSSKPAGLGSTMVCTNPVLRKFGITAVTKTFIPRKNGYYVKVEFSGDYTGLLFVTALLDGPGDAYFFTPAGHSRHVGQVTKDEYAELNFYGIYVNHKIGGLFSPSRKSGLAVYLLAINDRYVPVQITAKPGVAGRFRTRYTSGGLAMPIGYFYGTGPRSLEFTLLEITDPAETYSSYWQEPRVRDRYSVVSGYAPFGEVSAAPFLYGYAPWTEDRKRYEGGMKYLVENGGRVLSMIGGGASTIFPSTNSPVSDLEKAYNRHLSALKEIAPGLLINNYRFFHWAFEEQKEAAAVPPGFLVYQGDGTLMSSYYEAGRKLANLADPELVRKRMADVAGYLKNTQYDVFNLDGGGSGFIQHDERSKSMLYPYHADEFDRQLYLLVKSFGKGFFTNGNGYTDASFLEMGAEWFDDHDWQRTADRLEYKKIWLDNSNASFIALLYHYKKTRSGLVVDDLFTSYLVMYGFIDTLAPGGNSFTYPPADYRKDTPWARPDQGEWFSVNRLPYARASFERRKHRLLTGVTISPDWRHSGNIEVKYFSDNTCCVINHGDPAEVTIALPKQYTKATLYKMNRPSLIDDTVRSPGVEPFAPPAPLRVSGNSVTIKGMEKNLLYEIHLQ